MSRRSQHLSFAAIAFIICVGVVATRQVFVASPLMAADFPEPLKIIEEEGQFIFHDGSSYYLFKKDGTFRSGPMGLSGREIEGKWKVDDRLFVIEGRWDWINGVSPADDYRRMVIYLSKPESVETVKRISTVEAGANQKIYKCYFLVEGLEKIAKIKS